MIEAFTPEQRTAQHAARRFFEVECTPQHVRSTWEPHCAPDRRRWRAMSSMGFFSMMVPEQYGGIGLSLPDLILLIEEAGYAALPEPFLETAALVVPAVAIFGSEAQREQWLPGIAAGDVMATAQIMGATTAPFGALSDVALIEANDELHLVPHRELVTRPATSMDPSRQVASLSATLDASTRLLGAKDDFAMVRAWAATAAAAFLNGINRHLVDRVLKHATERAQFGRPIGTFQAVKHLVSDAATQVVASRPSAWYAARALSRGTPDAADAAGVAKVMANMGSQLTNDVALQVHGGIGYTWEHDLHLWLKRGKVLETTYGSSRYHESRLGEVAMQSTDLMWDYGPSLTIR